MRALSREGEVGETVVGCTSQAAREVGAAASSVTALRKHLFCFPFQRPHYSGCGAFRRINSLVEDKGLISQGGANVACKY